MVYHLIHPEAPEGFEVEVDPQQAPMYLSQGWQTKPGAKPIVVED